MADEQRKKIDMAHLLRMKEEGQKASWLTAYDYPTALFEDKAGIEIIMPGDSGMMALLGHRNTLPATMEQMLWMTQAVARAVEYAFLIGDMPYMSYQVSKEEAIRNAGRFMAEGGVDCVKMEGGEHIAETMSAVVKAGVPVMGHIGMTPQSAASIGGYKSQGRSVAAAKKIISDAQTLEQAGAWAVLVEAVPARIARFIVDAVNVPVYGIGAGPDVDGQVVIVHDMLGLFEAFKPKFVRRYAELGKTMVSAFQAYKSDVKGGTFPGPEECYGISDEEYQRLEAELGG
ncbi:MAG: 3-methyl-2-oxobutanoate hydroxymethyltransferase [Chloroflexota bacterium]